MPEVMSGTRNPSFWKQTSDPVGYPPLEGDQSAEVAIIGGGLVGLTTALLLKRSGIRIAVIEAGRVGEGTTGYSSAKLTSLHGLVYASIEESLGETGAHIYAEANEWAISAIADTVEELQIDCRFERHPALTFTRDPDKVDLFQRELEAARRAGLPVVAVTDSDLPFPIEAGIRLEEQASFHPLRYCLALAAAVDGEGSRVYEESRAVTVEEKESPAMIRTSSGATVRAPSVILSCGMPFLDRAGFFARLQPSRSYCVAMDGASPIPESLSINAGEPTFSIRPITAPDGKRFLLISGAGHEVGRAEDTEASYDILEAFGRRHFGADEVIARWSAQDYLPIDGLPLIGRMPLSADSLYVAGGFAKWGLTMGTAAARILRDLILEDENPWSQPFDAQRAQIPKELGTVVKEGASDAKRFVGDRIRQGTAPSVDDLRPGTGGIHRHDGKVVAAFRDDDGRLYMVSPTCTHMGCRVSWNEAERSWDCPCHGSRFSIEGEILNGPAVKPLEAR